MEMLEGGLPKSDEELPKSYGESLKSEKELSKIEEKLPKKKVFNDIDFYALSFRQDEREEIFFMPKIPNDDFVDSLMQKDTYLKKIIEWIKKNSKIVDHSNKDLFKNSINESIKKIEKKYFRSINDIVREILKILFNQLINNPDLICEIKDLLTQYKLTKYRQLAFSLSASKEFSSYNLLNVALQLADNKTVKFLIDSESNLTIDFETIIFTKSYEQLFFLLENKKINISKNLLNDLHFIKKYILDDEYIFFFEELLDKLYDVSYEIFDCRIKQEIDVTKCNKKIFEYKKYFCNFIKVFVKKSGCMDNIGFLMEDIFFDLADINDLTIEVMAHTPLCDIYFDSEYNKNGGAKIENIYNVSFCKYRNKCTSKSYPKDKELNRKRIEKLVKEKIKEQIKEETDKYVNKKIKKKIKEIIEKVYKLYAQEKQNYCQNGIKNEELIEELVKIWIDENIKKQIVRVKIKKIQEECCKICDKIYKINKKVKREREHIYLLLDKLNSFANEGGIYIDTLVDDIIARKNKYTFIQKYPSKPRSFFSLGSCFKINH